VAGRGDWRGMRDGPPRGGRSDMGGDRRGGGGFGGGGDRGGDAGGRFNDGAGATRDSRLDQLTKSSSDSPTPSGPSGKYVPPSRRIV